MQPKSKSLNRLKKKDPLSSLSYLNTFSQFLIQTNLEYKLRRRHLSRPLLDFGKSNARLARSFKALQARRTLAREEHDFTLFKSRILKNIRQRSKESVSN